MTGAINGDATAVAGFTAETVGLAAVETGLGAVAAGAAGLAAVWALAAAVLAANKRIRMECFMGDQTPKSFFWGVYQALPVEIT